MSWEANFLYHSDPVIHEGLSDALFSMRKGFVSRGGIRAADLHLEACALVFCARGLVGRHHTDDLVAACMNIGDRALSLYYAVRWNIATETEGAGRAILAAVNQLIDALASWSWDLDEGLTRLPWGRLTDDEKAARVLLRATGARGRPALIEALVREDGTTEGAARKFIGRREKSDPTFCRALASALEATRLGGQVSQSAREGKK